MIKGTVTNLGELVDIKTGKLDANASSPDGAYPFFTCAREPLKIDRWAYDGDYVLVAGNGDLNVKHFIGKFEAYQRTYLIKVRDTRRLNSRYLFHFLDSYLEVLRQRSIGGVIKYIKLGFLTEAKFWLPSLEEQSRIAAILDKAEAIYRKRRQVLELYQSFLRSAFLSMFGDPIENQKNLEQVQLGKLVSVVSGATPSKGNEQFWNGDIPWVSPKDMKSFWIETSIDRVSDVATKEANLKLLSDRSILVVVRGMILAHTVPIAVNRVPVTINQDIKALIAKAGVESVFLAWSLLVQHDSILKKVSTASHGTKRIETDVLLSLPIILPPKREQERFVDIVERYRVLLANTKRQLLTSEKLFRSLSDTFFYEGGVAA